MNASWFNTWLQENHEMNITATQRSSMKLFLNQEKGAEETARRITARVQSINTLDDTMCDKELNEDKLLHLWAFIVDIIQAAPLTAVLTNVLDLLAAIAKLPLGPNLKEPEPWADLPKFITYFSDTWDADYAWRGSYPEQHTDNLDAEAQAVKTAVWVNMNAFTGIALSQKNLKREFFVGTGMTLLHAASCLV